MKSLKFAPGDQLQPQFAVAVRKNVYDYFTTNGISPKGNVALYLQSLVMFSALIIPFIILLVYPVSLGMGLMLVILMGIGTAGIGMCVMHDAAHGSYSKHEWINTLLAGTMYVLGSNVLNWKIQHNVLHHTFTNINDYDQDIASRGPIRLSDHAPLKKMHRYQHIHAFFFYGLMTMFKLARDFTQLLEYNRSGYTQQQKLNPTKEYVRMLVVKVIYFLVMIGLPMLLTPFTWWQVLLGFAIMHFVTGLILGTVFQMAHVVEGVDQPVPTSEGIIENDWIVHELQTTCNFAMNNLFLNWYVGGLNFQIEHHLFPHVCHIHYRKIAPIVRETALAYGLPYHVKPTFRDALRSHVKRLKALGRTPMVQMA